MVYQFRGYRYLSYSWIHAKECSIDIDEEYVSCDNIYDDGRTSIIIYERVGKASDSSQTENMRIHRENDRSTLFQDEITSIAILNNEIKQEINEAHSAMEYATKLRYIIKEKCMK